MGCARGTGILICITLGVSLAAGCGSGTPSGYALKARGGAYVDGTGRLGLAVLATVRDGSGAGPAAEWTGTLAGPLGPAGGVVTYDSPGAGSWVGAWWPDETPYAGSYSLELSPAGGAALSVALDVGDGTGIAPAQPTLTGDGTAISWTLVPGAAAYECRVHGEGGGVVLRRVGNAAACDLSALAPGAYAVSVLAYSADVAALGQSGSRSPALPERFDVSEARVAFAPAGTGAPAALVDAAGGAFSDGTSWTGLGLAIWVSIRNPDGSPPAAPWAVEVVGPGLDPAAPLTFTYPAQFTRILVWTGAVPVVSGSYGIVARAGDASVARAFAVGAVEAIGAPTGVAASDGAQGSASVTWTAVAGAASYLVTARHRSDHAFVMNQWVAGTTASFPAGTFVAGEAYDVYVAATDADMVGGAAPTQLAITENSFQPSSFVAR